jgi:hypothetical protein
MTKMFLDFSGLRRGWRWPMGLTGAHGIEHWIGLSEDERGAQGLLIQKIGAPPSNGAARRYDIVTSHE